MCAAWRAGADDRLVARRTAAVAGLSIDENGVQLAVDVVGGHKTGFYLDQRDNRAWLRSVAAGKEILNCFCYTGGFSLQALAGGRRNRCCPSTRPAGAGPGAANLALNPQLPAERAEWLEADVFQALRDFPQGRRTFDLIVLDPPKFAPRLPMPTAPRPTRTSTCSASAAQTGRPVDDLLLFGRHRAGTVPEDRRRAALDAGREARIVRRLSGTADHPVALNFPEGEYLKGLLVQVD